VCVCVCVSLSLCGTHPYYIYTYKPSPHANQNNSKQQGCFALQAYKPDSAGLWKYRDDTGRPAACAPGSPHQYRAGPTASLQSISARTRQRNCPASVRQARTRAAHVPRAREHSRQNGSSGSPHMRFGFRGSIVSACRDPDQRVCTCAST